MDRGLPLDCSPGFPYKCLASRVARWRYPMPARVKITVGIGREIDEYLRQEQRRRKIPMSRIVEDALVQARRRDRERALRDGYLAMAAEDARSAENTVAAQLDALD